MTDALFVYRARRALVRSLAAALAAVALPLAARAELTCDVVFRMESDVEFAGVQFQADYGEAAGNFVGSGSQVSCTELTDSLMGFNDRNDLRSLLVGVLDPDSLDGPLDLARCKFVGTEVPDMSTIPVTVLDASDVDGIPLDPLPTVGFMTTGCMTDLCAATGFTAAIQQAWDERAATATAADRALRVAGQPAVYTVDFHLEASPELGYMTVVATYEDVGGEFLGTALDPDCTLLTGGFLQADDDSDERRLTLGVVSPAGFSGPADLVRCRFESTEAPTVDTFQVEVIVAGNVLAEPVEPLPTVTIGEIECISGACTDEPPPVAISTCLLPTVGADEGDELGTSVAITPSLLVVGAPGDGAGRAHLFEMTSGSIDEVLQSTPVAVPFADADGGDAAAIRFGAAVDVDKDTVVVGAPLDAASPASGSVSVFARTAGVWALQAKLSDETGSCAGLGADVAVSGDIVVAGAPDGGCALVFQRTGTSWSRVATLESDSAAARFGLAVDVSGERILVSEPGALVGTGCAPAGKVHVFRRNAGIWSLEDTVDEPQQAGAGACFGAAVALDGAVGVVGAPYDDAAADDAGAAYVLEPLDGEWDVTAQLLATPASLSGHRFGFSVDIKSEAIIVGAPGVAAFVFTRSPGLAAAERAIAGKWKQDRIYIPPDPESPKLSKFGFSVAIASGTVAIGAPAEMVGNEADVGAVYPDDAGPVAATICGDGNPTDTEECDDGDVLWTKGQSCNALCERLACGDPDDNGKIASGDALFALRTAIGAAVCDLAVCDVDGSRVVTSSDALFILRKAIGRPVPFKCP